MEAQYCTTNFLSIFEWYACDVQTLLFIEVLVARNSSFWTHQLVDRYVAIICSSKNRNKQAKGFWRVHYTESKTLLIKLPMTRKMMTKQNQWSTLASIQNTYTMFSYQLNILVCWLSSIRLSHIFNTGWVTSLSLVLYTSVAGIIGVWSSSPWIDWSIDKYRYR